MNAPLSVLFVDDEANVLQALRRSLRRKAGEWDMVFAGSGPEALETMAARPFDIVVTDMRMPGMDGAQLLLEVRRRHPDAIRFVLSGQSDEESVYRSIGISHQYLSKPCEGDVLVGRIDRALALRQHFRNPALRALIGGRLEIPARPAIFTRLIAALTDSRTMTRHIAGIIELDPGLATRVLQAANSAFFGPAREVTSIERAVELLGFDVLKGIALKQDVLNMLPADPAGSNPPESVFDHSVRVAALARSITALPGFDPRLGDDCYALGLLHDLGIVILARLQEGLHDAGEGTYLERERLLLGVGHDEVMSYVLGLWGLPDMMVEAVMRHHEQPPAGGALSQASAVLRLANEIDHLLDSGTDADDAWQDLATRLALPDGVSVTELRALATRLREGRE
jgi:HD-like signal output (HDOD) protein/CheY-like chemotaxis protein